MENNKYLTAKQSHQIAREKIEIYNKQCEINAELYLPTVMDLIEKAANEKHFNYTIVTRDIDYESTGYLSQKLLALGYVVDYRPINVTVSISISW